MAGVSDATSRHTVVHLGGYTSDQPEGSSGLARTSWTGSGFGPIEALSGPGDPSWLALVRGGDLLCAVAEDGDEVALVDPAEGVVATCPSGGMGPCHLALSPGGRWAAVANYVSGSVGLVRLGSSDLELVDTLELDGDGPHERQDSSHAHQVVWLDDASMLVCDLGADRVRQVSLEGDGELRHTGDIALPPGTGPRHLALHPGRDDVAWVVGELDQTVHVLRREGDGTQWSAGASASTAPDGPAEGETTTAGIVVAPDGSHVYVSTRGTDTVSVFRSDADGLELVQQVATDDWPRFIGWLPGAEGELLLVAAERAGTVAALPVRDGRLGEALDRLRWAAPTWAG